MILYGRYCNANKFAGGVDLFEALEDVKRDYHMDENRTLVRGFSMGGAGTWYIASHFADDVRRGRAWRWLCGDARISACGDKAAKDPAMKPTWWEEKLWKLTDATDYAANFFQLPIVAYNGEIDPQKQAADIMAPLHGRRGTHAVARVGSEYGAQVHAGCQGGDQQQDRRDCRPRPGSMAAADPLHHLDPGLQPDALGGGGRLDEALGSRACGCGDRKRATRFERRL